jgi:hypothetical protein
MDHFFASLNELHEFRVLVKQQAAYIKAQIVHAASIQQEYQVFFRKVYCRQTRISER